MSAAPRYRHARVGGSLASAASTAPPAEVLASPPSIDRGEITDKGSINQRAVLAHREALIEHLYRGGDDVLLWSQP